MTDIRPPSPEYVGPAAHDSGPGNKPVHRIVLHSTVGPCTIGAARNVAAWFRNPAAQGSANYVVDPGETLQVVLDDVIAWHAPPNAHSIGIEMCDYPDATSARRWKDKNHQEMLDRTARLTARLCLAYGVPIRYVGRRGLKAGRRGITTHNEVSLAFGQSSHWDPGKWPRRKFMRLVKAHAKRIRERAKEQR